jgi:dienelactone hydrolase
MVLRAWKGRVRNAGALAQAGVRPRDEQCSVRAVERADVTVPSGGLELAAWLYRPDGEGPHPIVVMAHGFSGTRELRLDAYAERFAAAGMAALVFDYRHFGASPGEPRQLLDIAAQHADYHAALAFARSLEGIDPERVALFGSSFSGGHVIEVAVADGRVRAIVCQCPFQDGLATLPRLGLANVAKLTAAGLRDQTRALLGREPHYVAAVGPPGATAVMTTPDSEPGFRRMLPEETTWENRVAARIALRVALYRPARKAARLPCPGLWCICDEDSLVPRKQALAAAEAAPVGSEIRRYPIGHFDIYVGEWFELAVSDQTEFLERQLMLRTPAPAGRARA